MEYERVAEPQLNYLACPICGTYVREDGEAKEHHWWLYHPLKP